MKKRIWYIGCVIIIIVCFLFMNNILSDKRLYLGETIEKLFVLNGWEECYLVKLGGITNIIEREIVPEVTEKDIAQYTELELKDKAYRESITNRTVVEINDLAITDYKIMDGAKEVKVVSDAPIRVGSGYYDTFLETAILGLKIGKEHIVDWKVPAGTANTEWSGKDLKIHIMIKELYEVKIPTVEEYASQNGFQNIEEYEEYVKNILLEEKIKVLQSEAIESIIEEIIKKSKFKTSDDVVVENAIQYYYKYNEFAHIYDTSVEELIRDSTSDDIYDKCYKDSLREIQRYMVIGGYAKEKDIKVSESEIESYCVDNDVVREQLTEEDLVYIEYELIEEKVLTHIREHYVILKLQ